MGDDGRHEGRGIALVFAGGDRPEPDALDGVPDDALVVAADSGLHHAQALGRHVDVVVGDFDSVDPAALAAAERAGATVERHNPDKDATDLELALTAARDRGCTHLVVVGGIGGRLDHSLANALLLAAPALATVTVEARMGAGTAHVVRDSIELDGLPGDLVTLLPVGGPARGVTTEHLRFPLRGESLEPGSTRGVSNELVTSPAHVALDDGVLLVILPHRRKAAR
jgi:thiamine pyrophosphokinase